MDHISYKKMGVLQFRRGRANELDSGGLEND